MKYKLATDSWDKKEYQAIDKVIKSGNFTMGKNVERFENKCASFFNSNHCLMVNSGSSANLLMIAALFFKKSRPLKRGDEVIVPAVSWSTTYAPLQQYGLKVKFVDINKDTLNFCLKDLENAISSKTKLILSVNLLGNSNDFISINKLINKRKIYLLEDNCESLGAKFDNKFTGTFGLMGTFSSFFSHHISTMEGGFVLTNNQELYHIMLSLRAHGWTRNLPDSNMLTGKKSDDLFEESFKFILPGYNLRPLELSGAIGLEQIKKINSIIKNRRKNAKIFISIINKFDWINCQKEIGESSWFGFALILAKHINRKNLLDFLRSNDIETRPIVTGNFIKNKKLLNYFDYSINSNLKNSNYIDKNGFFIGNNHEDLSKPLARLEKILLEFQKKYKL